MDELMSLRIFLEVARRRSFAGAAGHFALSPATVTKHVAALERTMQTRLLNRTTKKMSLTPAGLEVVGRGEAVIVELEAMRSRVAALSNDLAGDLRVGVAPSFGARRLTPVIRAFSAAYPNVRVSLTLLTERKEETFVSEGMDVGVIAGTALKDATHSAIKLADMPQVLVASPAFVRRHPALRTPSDLAKVNCLVNTMKSPTGHWNFEGPDGPVTRRVDGSLRSNFGEVLMRAAMDGMGVSMHPLYMVSEELRAGLLEIVMPDYAAEPLQMFAIYSRRSAVPVRVRAFLDFLKSWRQRHPKWPVEWQ